VFQEIVGNQDEWRGEVEKFLEEEEEREGNRRGREATRWD